MRAQPTASHFIDGAYVEDTAGAVIECIYAASGEVIARLHEATPALIDKALAMGDGDFEFNTDDPELKMALMYYFFDSSTTGSGAVRPEAMEFLKDAIQHNPAIIRAGQESELPNFKGSYLGRLPLVSADFWTSDHLSERSRSVDVFSVTRARETLTLKRR